MEKEFAEFLSEELLDFVPMAATRIIWPLALLISVNALTKLTSKEVEEYLTQHNDDYCSTSETNALSIELSQGPSHTSKFSRKFAMPKSDNEVAEVRIRLEYQLRHE